ncbi:hypothetical protein ACIRNI_06570 [Streptomyces sp. NPDC093546]|uniref:hypothetical protein n=1 Tax=Streptomyces sp. NPDC093546 TaxID=3366040 RepID=UPI00382C953D
MTVETAPAPEAPETPAAPRPPRRRLRALARWATAVLVCGGVGTGVAYGITSMDRGDVPGLATASDGRWAYPKLALPALPEGSPRPFTEGNEGEVHHADPRALLLPAPAGAVVDKGLDGGWVTVDRYLAEYEPDQRAELRQALTDLAVRNITARGWTMPDGTRSRVYLLRFGSVAYAQMFQSENLRAGADAGVPPTGSPVLEPDGEWPGPDLVQDTSSYAYEETKPYGPERTRLAYIVAGDTVAMIVQSRKGDTAEVPFHQTVVLQNQLLG